MFQRLPKFSEILPVYAVIASALFGWSIVAFLWKLPSWLMSFTLGDVLAFLAYTFTSDLLESLAWLAALLLLSFLLPARFIRDHFAERGALISLVTMISLILLLAAYAGIGAELLDVVWFWLPATAALAILLVFFSTKTQWIGKSVMWIADNLTIFLFLLIPLAVLSALAVLWRNIF